MKQLNYKLKAKHAGDPDSNAWLEDMSYWVEDSVTAEQHGRSIIDYFNSTLQPYEDPREFVAAILPDDGTQSEKPMAEEAPKLHHQWEKVSLVTEKGGYDRMRCKICGVKGKRYALGTSPRADLKSQQYCKGQKK